MKIKFVGYLVTLLAAIFCADVSAATIGDIVRNQDGTVRLMLGKAAFNYCQRNGKRLPTLREYAEYGALHGALGIRDTQYSGQKIQVPEVLTEIRRNAHDGYKMFEDYRSYSVDFYYNASGYVMPSGDDGKNAFWSYSPDRKGYLHAFFGNNGIISDLYGDEGLAVRCVNP
jgi:hypothetical protein